MSRISTFNPNDQGVPYATYCPRRKGAAFRGHGKLGHAVCAFSIHGDAILYEFQNDKWVELVRKDHENLPTFCKNCKQSVMVTRSLYNVGLTRKVDTQVNIGTTKLLRAGGKLLQPLEVQHLCRDCSEIFS